MTLPTGEAPLIEAELTSLHAQDALLQARTRLTAEFVALEKALGLGWSEGSGRQ